MQKVVKYFQPNSKPYGRYKYLSCIVSKVYLSYIKYVPQFNSNTVAAILLDIFHYHNVIHEKNLYHILRLVEYYLVYGIFSFFTLDYENGDPVGYSYGTIYVNNKNINKVINYSEKKVKRNISRIEIIHSSFSLVKSSSTLQLTYKDKLSYFTTEFNTSLRSTHTLFELFELYNICKKEILIENKLIS